MTPTRQKLVRDLVAAKRALDAADKAAAEARNAYRLAESLYLKEVPISGRPPSDVFCDPFVISVNDDWQRDGTGPRLDFTLAERCPTSE